VRSLKRIGLILLVLIAIVAGTVFWAGKFMGDSQEELAQAARTIIVGIAEGKWSREAMLQYSSPELKRWIIERDYSEYARYATLGQVKEFLGIRDWKQTSGLKKTKASLLAGVIYEGGGAEVHLSLSKIDDQWLLDSFKLRLVGKKREAALRL